MESRAPDDDGVVVSVGVEACRLTILADCTAKLTTSRPKRACVGNRMLHWFHLSV